MNNRISFNINNGDKQIWEQSVHDGSVKLYTLADDWTEENTIFIPAGDMVMFANLYRRIKDGDITEPFLNADSKKEFSNAVDIINAVERQIPKKPIKVDKYHYDCPTCNSELDISEEDIFIYNITTPSYCRDCGQALDWSDNNG